MLESTAKLRGWTFQKLKKHESTLVLQSDPLRRCLGTQNPLQNHDCRRDWSIRATKTNQHVVFLFEPSKASSVFMVHYTSVLLSLNIFFSGGEPSKKHLHDSRSPPWHRAYEVPGFHSVVEPPMEASLEFHVSKSSKEANFPNKKASMQHRTCLQTDCLLKSPFWWGITMLP